MQILLMTLLLISANVSHSFDYFVVHHFFAQDDWQNGLVGSSIVYSGSVPYACPLQQWVNFVCTFSYISIRLFLGIHSSLAVLDQKWLLLSSRVF